MRTAVRGHVNNSPTPAVEAARQAPAETDARLAVPDDHRRYGHDISRIPIESGQAAPIDPVQLEPEPPPAPSESLTQTTFRRNPADAARARAERSGMHEMADARAPPITARSQPEATGHDPEATVVWRGAPTQGGIPEHLGAAIGALSGIDVSDIAVHRNSAKPATIGALAYASGDRIHLGPGQAHHLPHEAWHIVQQRQGRVPPTMATGAVAINDDPMLEHEASVMGERAVRLRTALANGTGAPSHAHLQGGGPAAATTVASRQSEGTIQRVKSPVDNQLKKTPYKKWANRRSDRRGGVRKAKWLREYEAQVKAAKRFVEKTVAPWATQARISELIDENMHDLRADKSVTTELKTLKPHLLRTSKDGDPQIAPGKSELLAPSRTHADGATAIHRGDVEIEMIGEQPFVRIYASLWAEARPDNKGEIKFKDVHQHPETGEITIHTGRDQGEQRDDDADDPKMPIMWISAGQPLRQLKWFYKYPLEKHNPGARPVIRSFLIPLDVWNKISAAAVDEADAKDEANKDKPFNVDTAYSANQFGVRGPMLQVLRENARPGSLVSYVGKPEHSRPDLGGNVRGINALRKKLGAPTTPEPTPVWVDPEVGRFVRTKKQASIADEMMFYYGVWTGNDDFVPPARLKVPVLRRQQMLREYLASQGVPLPDSYTLPTPRVRPQAASPAAATAVGGAATKDDDDQDQDASDQDASGPGSSGPGTSGPGTSGPGTSGPDLGGKSGKGSQSETSIKAFAPGPNPYPRGGGIPELENTVVPIDKLRGRLAAIKGLLANPDEARRRAGAQPLNSLITHVDWQIAAMEPDGNERAEFRDKTYPDKQGANVPARNMWLFFGELMEFRRKAGL